MFIFAGFGWALWTSRNKMAIEKSFPQMPTDVIYNAISLMQKWSILLKKGGGQGTFHTSEGSDVGMAESFQA
jgi:hypothetical protein